jgi:hypothetical protein
MAGEFLKKAAATKEARKASVDLSLVDQDFAAEYPAISEFLTLAKVDGQARETSTLLILFEDGLFKAMLNDRENRQTLWVSSETHADLLTTLEVTLTTEPVRWRPSRDQGLYIGRTKKQRG